MDRDKLSNLYRGPPIDDTYQVSAYLAKRFQRRRFFRNQPIRNKNCLWWPCLLTDRERNQQSLQKTFQRCFLPSYGSFGLTVSEEKILKNQPIQKQEYIWRPCLLMDWDEMSKLYRCFQPSFSSFGKGVSEEKIKM